LPFLSLDGRTLLLPPIGSIPLGDFPFVVVVVVVVVVLFFKDGRGDRGEVEADEEEEEEEEEEDDDDFGVLIGDRGDNADVSDNDPSAVGEGREGELDLFACFEEPLPTPIP
jgi:hypothetical protein